MPATQVQGTLTAHCAVYACRVRLSEAPEEACPSEKHAILHLVASARLRSAGDDTREGESVCALISMVSFHSSASVATSVPPNLCVTHPHCPESSLSLTAPIFPTFPDDYSRCQTSQSAGVRQERLRCESCGLRFENADELTSHVRNVHKTLSRRPSQSLSWRCPGCKRVFGSMQEVTEHVLVAGQQYVAEGESASGEDDERDEFNPNTDEQQASEGKVGHLFCRECAKMFRSERHLRRHFNVAHGGLGTVMFACGLQNCFALPFPTRSGLQRHLRVVHGDRSKFPCPHQGCHKSYSIRGELNRHFKTVHTPKRFTCSFEGCDSKFSLKYKLVQHMQKVHYDL